MVQTNKSFRILSIIKHRAISARCGRLITGANVNSMVTKININGLMMCNIVIGTCNLQRARYDELGDTDGVKHNDDDESYNIRSGKSKIHAHKMLHMCGKSKIQVMCT